MTKEEALKLAKKWFEHNTYSDEADKVYEAIEQALAQPEQEPVAWLNKEKNTIIWDKIYPDMKPLYTTTPQHQPLTDEEIDKAWRSCDYTVPWEQHRIDIARAIEAAHGIKE